MNNFSLWTVSSLFIFSSNLFATPFISESYEWTNTDPDPITSEFFHTQGSVNGREDEWTALASLGQFGRNNGEEYVKSHVGVILADEVLYESARISVFNEVTYQYTVGINNNSNHNTSIFVDWFMYVSHNINGADNFDNHAAWSAITQAHINGELLGRIDAVGGDTSFGVENLSGKKQYEIEAGESLSLQVILTSFAHIGRAANTGGWDEVVAYTDPAIYVDPSFQFSNDVDIDFIRVDNSLLSFGFEEGASLTTSIGVPEPSTFAIFAVGVIGFASRRFTK